MSAGQEKPSDRAVFTPFGDGRRFAATEWAIGPWSPDFCHGGAPSALLVQVADQVASPTPMNIARATVDLLRPAPIGVLEVDWSIIRDGRKLQLIELRMLAGGMEVARASVLRLRLEDGPSADLVVAPALGLPEPTVGVGTRSPQRAGFSAMFEMRSVKGGFERLGPASVWFRMNGVLVEGMAPSAAAETVAAADFGNGIAGVLPFEAWSYPSTDLTVSFARAPRDAWTMVDAEIWAPGEGRALCHCRLGDEHGWMGRALQTSIVEKR